MRFMPTKLVNLELAEPLVTLNGLEKYHMVCGLVRLHGIPLGEIELPVVNGQCRAEDMYALIFKKHVGSLIVAATELRLAQPVPPEGLLVEDLLTAVSPPPTNTTLPLVTVAVCTRNHANELPLCLDALLNLDYPHLDIIVVDNAPQDETTQQLLHEYYPEIRYVCEPRPGLDWARNRAILEARGEIIAYTDDDVVVDANWIKAIVAAFADAPETMAVTGLVLPYELETEAQSLFEELGGFSRGFKAKYVSLGPTAFPWHWQRYGTGDYGTGANMAYRRSLFAQIGLFDPALDVGTVTNGGGDLEMFFRVIKEGHGLCYEPNAIVFHRHRRDYASLHTQITNNGVGFMAYLHRSFLHYKDARLGLAKLGFWWLRAWLLGRLVSTTLQPETRKRSLARAECKGSLIGLKRYPQACQQVAEVVATYGEQPALVLDGAVAVGEKRPLKGGTAVCNIDLSQPLQPLGDEVAAYARVRLYVTCGPFTVGQVEFENGYQQVGVQRLRRIIAANFSLKLFDLAEKVGEDAVLATLQAGLSQHYGWQGGETAVSAPPNKLPNHLSASIVIATFDRPDDLRSCLHSLSQLETERPVEIVVVDNHPSSGLTPPVVADFPHVILVNETRQGLSYARNTGITTSSGDIVIATDDDVEVPPQWLETLIAPFIRPEVMIVTGNVFPKLLDNSAQQGFEQYGGLGRGFQPKEANREWFESFIFAGVRTWELGATANAAFRASIFADADIGLMHEALGAGMPTGVAEDTYLFYKVLKAGYTLVYEPSAFVWHKHRHTMAALRKQLYSYSKGHVAYHIITFLQDGDWRGLIYILYHLPAWRVRQILMHLRDLVKGKLLRGQGHYPIAFTAVEIAGNLLGPWSLWQAYRRVWREGRSAPYVPPCQRPSLDEEPAEQELLYESVGV